MQVLKKYSEVIESRKILKKEQISFIDSYINTLLRKLKIINNVSIGDLNKSWDILKFKNFIVKNLKKDDSILDIGCYGSEILLSLNKLGFKNLSGIDLNDGIFNMPYQKLINYSTCDFMNTGFDNNSFNAITSVSVIEHGLDSYKLFTEMSRILKIGGYILISFDYWPNKIDTSNIKLFNMEWNIFSKEEVELLIKEASNQNLEPINKISFDANTKAISHVGFNYTFGLIIFKKIK